MTNKLYVGFFKEVKPPKAGLFLDDKVPKTPLAKVFDPKKHSFNPLAGIDYKKARASRHFRKKYESRVGRGL